MQIQNEKDIIIDSLYQKLSMKIKLLQDEYKKNPTQQKQEELLRYLKGQQAYVSLTTEEKGQLNQLVLKMDSFSIEVQKSYIIKQMAKSKHTKEKKVMVQLGAKTESIQVPYILCSLFLQSLEMKKEIQQETNKPLDNKGIFVVKKPISDIQICITSIVLAACIVITSGVFNIKLERNSRHMNCAIRNVLQMTTLDTENLDEIPYKAGKVKNKSHTK